MNCEHVSWNLAYSIYYSMSTKKQTWGVSSKTRRVQYLFYPPRTFYYFIIFHYPYLQNHFTIFLTPSSLMGVFFALWRRVGNSASTYIHFRWLKSLPSGQSRHPLNTYPQYLSSHPSSTRWMTIDGIGLRPSVGCPNRKIYASRRWIIMYHHCRIVFLHFYLKFR